MKKVKAKNLHRGCLGNIHLLGKRHGYEISVIEDEIIILAKYPKRKFEELIEPCVESSTDYIYNQNYTGKDQILNYQIISKKNKNIVNSLQIIDKLNLIRSKDDFKLQQQLGMAVKWEQVQAWNNLMYKPLYSPLLNLGDELCLFNHTSGYIEFSTLNGENKRSTPITYHKNKGWHQQILFDSKKNKIYTAFNTKKGKTIHHINLTKGTTEPVLFLECTFVEKMDIEDGYLFYLESGRDSAERNRILQKVKVDE